jgi:hypothetical protein
MRSKIISLSLLMCLLSLAVVAAFGVSSPYWEGNPLELEVGSSELVKLQLQNGAGATEAVTASVTLVEGSELTSIDEEMYTVEAGGSVDVEFLVESPSNAKVGDVFKIKVEVKTGAAGDTEGTVAMGTGMSSTFDVIIVESTTPKEKSKLWMYLIIAVVVIVAIYLLTKKKPSAKKRR